MQEPELNEQSGFMIEKIKERPVNKKKLLRRTIITAAMAVIFGLIACFTFLILEPVISNFLYPEEDTQIVVFPEDQEEMSPEEMLADNMQQENQANQVQETETEVSISKAMVEEIVSGITLNKDDYRQLYLSVTNYVNEIDNSMVIVTSVTSDVDWLNNVEEREHQSSGVIVADNGKELLIMADYTPLKNAENLTVTFYNDVCINAQLKGVDGTTNLAIIAVDLVELSKEMSIDNLPIADFGSSNAKSLLGTPVIALGSPMGINGSVGYGIITAVTDQQSAPDTNYKLLQTDMQGSQNAGGVLFNLSGQIIGVITNNKSGLEMTDMITAYGISSLKKRMENISNGRKTAYLGISGVDVTKEANEELNVPYGAYITEVEIDSPSMLAGIQQGDVLVSIGGRKVYSYSEYANIVTQLQAGDTVEVSVMRLAQDEYKKMNFEIVLGEMQDEIY